MDVIANHMTGQWYMPLGTAGSTANPGNKEYPAVPYRPLDFHDTCLVTDMNNPSEVRDCEFLGLKDLDQVMLKKINNIYFLTVCIVVYFKINLVLTFKVNFVESIFVN